PLSSRAKGILESAANQLAAVLENARLYRQVERLFRAYLSPDVVRTLLADPARARLGGASTEATILFADLRGYTAFSVGADPAAIVELLNRYFGTVVPLILAEGGTVAQFVGDAIMAIFNAPVAQPDHPLRAARAALAMQRAIEALTAEHPAWPRFRVGIETGPVLVGNVGASEVRTFTAIGETTNLAARLQTFAQAGHIVVGPAAAERLEAVATLRRLDPVELSGFPDPVTSYELMSIP
ncbi:MAG: adenylate/guanylate cyclase domain-containing protein, partial [Candidatus Limnocylindrales bacterium]